MDLNEQGLAQYQAGDVVYVIYRNPHTQNVANVQEAAVVNNPDNPGELALFLYETYYPLNDQLAVYQSENEAMEDFQFYFGSPDMEV
ncbi:transcriptional regulator of the spore photoproduct lyase operon [Salirhabdus euzebyi]|uniref:Transcriptional regulator of the spore photoproduct lyase operon n=1 Tax=Salirhabdus euzebyi TaxID=394506 RepID=A0A841QAE2_9BACI|nr:transcriptional regulator SplA domain-containing protein [Salirhabdus euzebyi]MBB6455398.1 transcriptional regulator of the spore photoproduct lyase operon [Salirhabdus euzebyi]